MAPVAEKWTDIIYSQEVANPLLYAENILDKGRLGQISVKEASKDPIFQTLVGGNLTQLILSQTNVTDNRNGTLPEQDNTNDDFISIEDELASSIVRRLGAVSVSVKSDEEQGKYYTMLPEHTPLKSAVEIASLKKI